MAEEDKGIFGGFFDPPEQNISPETVGAIDYLTDIPIGAIKGVSQAVQGLLQLGALPIDYLADTNLITAIDNIFEKITPETDTAVGDITSILGQFALPAGVAIKLANGITKLSKASQIVKLNSLPTVGAKSAELAKRAGYYGSIGGITDFAVSTPGDLTTLSETFGFGEAYKGDELEGSAKAAEFFKEKIRFGAEGTVLGGGITAALPVAGTLGLKYGLMPAGKYVALPVGRATLRTVNNLVFNPLSKVIGSETVGAAARTTGEFLGNQSTKLRQKLNIPDPKEWKFYSTSSNAPLLERLLKRFDNIKNAFKSDGPISASQADELRQYENLVQKDEKGLVKIMNQIDNQFKEIAKGADVLELPKYLTTPGLKYPKPITAVDDAIYLRNNDLLYNYIQAPRVLDDAGKKILGDSNEALGFLKQLEDSVNTSGINKKTAASVIKNAKELKK